MTDHFNPTQTELLLMLAEEASEVVKAVTKLLRHGKHAHDVNALGKIKHYDNASDLTSEIDDIVAIIRQLDTRNIINSHWQDGDVLQDVWERKMPFTHYQPKIPPEFPSRATD